MSNEITLHTGFLGDHNIIYIDWGDGDGTKQTTEIQLNFSDEDKNRYFDLLVNGVKIHRELFSYGLVFCPSCGSEMGITGQWDVYYYSCNNSSCGLTGPKTNDPNVARYKINELKKVAGK